MTGVKDAIASKSARKREHLALQALGERLIGLPVSELKKMQLDEALFEAIVEAKSIRSRAALRRQRQLIGKLMRSADANRIETALESREYPGRHANAIFHSAEEWRERICNDGLPALAAFGKLTGRDNARLAGLVREYDDAVAESRKRAARRRLFREIHEELKRIDTEKEDQE